MLFLYVLDMPNHLLHKDWDNLMRPNPPTILRSIFVVRCHGMYGLAPRQMNHQCLIHAFPTLRHVSWWTSPMSSNEKPLTNHESTYMHHTSLPVLGEIGSWHTSLELDICHRYRNPTNLCTWTWKPSTNIQVIKHFLNLILKHTQH